jgi:hypothetical protein
MIFADILRDDARAAAYLLWGLLTLGLIVFMAIIVVWHLVRRGRLLRDRLAPPRPVDWPAPQEPAPEPEPAPPSANPPAPPMP